MKRLIAWMFCLLMAAPLWAQQSPETEISGLSRKEARRTMRGFKFFAEIGAYADVYRDASDEDDWIQDTDTSHEQFQMVSYSLCRLPD